MKVPKKELAIRKTRLQSELQNKCIEALLLTHPVDMEYLTGSGCYDYLYVPAEGEYISFAESASNTSRTNISTDPVFVGSVEEIPKYLKELSHKVPEVIGLQLDVLPSFTYFHLKTVFNPKKIVNGSQPIVDVRKVKSEWELDQMEKIAAITCQVFDNLMLELRPGITEMEFAAMAESLFQKKSQTQIRIRVRDYLTEGYPWHVLSGKSGGMVGVLDSPASGSGTSPAFPCGAGAKLLIKGEPIMVDFACELNGYHMDETRMFAIGSLSARAEDACKVAIEIHDFILDKIRPGITVGQVFDLSEKKARSLGYGHHYLGPEGLKVSFVGHGIGLELIEPPILAKGKSDQLLPGMTFALEPKLVFKDEFIAGIESVFAVTETGYRMISRTPAKLFYSESRY